MTWPIDVFVCHARPVASDGAFDLAAWSNKLLATLEEGINPNSFGDIPVVNFCREPRRAGEAAVPADAIEQSALLLVLLSPQLLADPARLAEIERFRAQAARDGRTVEHTVVATVAATPFERKDFPALDWLLGGGARAGAAEGFTDADGAPLETDRAGPGQPFDALRPAILSLAGDIRRKLAKLRAVPPVAPPPPPPTPPPPPPPEPEVVLDDPPGGPARALVYLQSASNQQSWTDTKAALDGLVRINPAQWLPPPGDLRAMKQRHEQRRAFLASCQGLILIRADAADLTDLWVTEAETDRNLLHDADFDAPPWVLVDWVPDAGPALQSWVSLPRVTTGEPNWPERVRKELGL